MNLQDTFYFLGIIFMILSLFILIGIVVLVFYIKNKITYIHDQIDDKLKDVNNYAVAPVKKVIDVATAFITNKSKSKKDSKN